MTRRIEIEIEELVLHGFDPGDRHAIGEALRSELGRLLGAREAPEAAPREFAATRPGDVGAAAGRAVAAEVSAAREHAWR